MTSLVVPGLDTLRQWLDDLGMSFFECDNCQALHLPHMQNFDGVFDAKIDLIDNTILFSAMAEVRPSAVLPLAADLSAINASSLTVKAFLDMQDDNLPKLVVCQSLSVMQGVTYEQFAWFVRQSEEQISTQTHPIDLVFTLPESDIATVVQAQKAGKPLVVEAWDRTNSKKLSEGTLLSLDNQIDATTGTIKVKARFNNQDDALFPNQFVNARMLVDTEQNAVVIPTAALQMGNEGHFVWVLNSENKVSKHLVTPGIQDSQKVVIRAGISAGDRVVTDGIDRLTEGAKVEVVEAQSATTPEEKATSREYAKKGARS